MQGFLGSERARFRALPLPAQRLLISTFSYSATVPLIFTFVNAYLWRQSRQLEQVVFYNASMCLSMPIGFYLAGLLLKRFKHYELYALGFVLQSLSMLLVVSLTSLSRGYLVLLGAAIGVSGGVYWSVRNILTIRYTSDSNRDYFFGIETGMMLLCSVLMPFLFGTLLEKHFFLGGILSLEQSYWVLFALVLIMTSFASFQILGANFETTHSTRLVPRSHSSAWRWARGVLVVKGFGDAASFILPALLTMTLIGEELALGTMQAVCAVAGALGIYLVGGRIRNIAQRLRLLRVGVFMLILGGTYLCLSYSAQGAAIFLLLQSVSSAIFWNSINPFVFGAIDQSAHASGDYFAFNCEREVFLNLGRVVALSLLGLCTNYGLDAKILMFFAVGVALSQVLLLPVAHQIARHFSATDLTLKIAGANGP